MVHCSSPCWGGSRSSRRRVFSSFESRGASLRFLTLSGHSLLSADVKISSAATAARHSDTDEVKVRYTGSRKEVGMPIRLY